ncbi:MAG: hypothetical protein DLM62_00970 [Pseudonocardiales bacterium]|nr:MAG: hypothetical protein DLM62_00970 [Pseudonocardiales bacterium]
MSEAVSFVQLKGQHVELLPARTVLSLFCGTTGGGTAAGPGTSGAAGTGGAAGAAGAGGAGGASPGGAPTFTSDAIFVDGNQYNDLTGAPGGTGGTGGGATGGAG